MMDFSLTVFSVGFLTSVLGALMVYISLRRGRDESHGYTGFLSTQLDRIRDSKRMVKFIFFLGTAVTFILVTVTLMGLLGW